MRTPAEALVWEAWRLTRGRFAIATGIAIAGCSAILAAAGERAGGAALLVPFLVAAIALVTIIDLPMAGSRFGFPFRGSFSRPVSTVKLALTPMIYLGALGAALYLVPVVAIGWLFDVAFPLAAAPAWIGVGVLALTAVSWWAKGHVTSFIGKVVVLFGTVELVRRLNPSSELPETLVPGIWPDVLYLSFAEVVALALLAAAAIVWAIREVQRQRHMADAASAPSGAGHVRGRAKVSVLERLRDAPAGLDRLRCPTKSATRAELWFETRRRGFPVVLASIGTAAVVALLLALTYGPEKGFPLFLVIGSFGVPLLAGVGVVGEGRARVAPGGLTPFEASRPISTASLTAVRAAVPAVSIFAGWVVIGSSLWFSLPPFRRAVAVALYSVSGVQLAAWAFEALVLFAAAVAACLAINACFVLYRRRLAGAFLCSFLYAVVLLGAAAVRLIGFEVIVWHLWGIAAAVGAGAALVFARAIAAGVLRPAHVAAAVLAWVLFAAVWVALVGDAVVRSGPMSVAAPAAATAALMPLLSLALAPWSLHRLRHT